jgi:hypothetical protein
MEDEYNSRDDAAPDNYESPNAKPRPLRTRHSTKKSITSHSPDDECRLSDDSVPVRRSRPQSHFAGRNRIAPYHDVPLSSPPRRIKHHSSNSRFEDERQ